jgi:hypothetical protein
MSKYKAGDKVTCEYVLDEIDADDLNNKRVPDFKITKIIAHERAPEPVVKYMNVYKDDICGAYISNLQTRTREDAHNWLGKIKVTLTGNDFTVGKCDE